MKTDLISQLEIQMILRISEDLYEESTFDRTDLIDKSMLIDCQKQLENADDIFNICSALETIHYYFSILLSEVRKNKRIEISNIFNKNKNIAEEKKALEKKLDSFPEYADLHYQEERLFQFLEHIVNIKNNITWLTKEKE